MIVEATDHWKKEDEKLIDYLNSFNKEAMRSNGNNSIVWMSYGLLGKFRAGTLNGTLEIPDCYTTPGSQGELHIMFGWNKNEHHLKCEVMLDGTFEMFYRNKLTKEVWGKDYLQNPPENFVHYTELWEKLSLFVE